MIPLGIFLYGDCGPKVIVAIQPTAAAVPDILPKALRFLARCTEVRPLVSALTAPHIPPVVTLFFAYHSVAQRVARGIRDGGML